MANWEAKVEVELHSSQLHKRNCTLASSTSATAL